MNLIIDIGNTLTKIATFKDDQMKDLWNGPYARAPQAIDALMKAQAFEAAIVSTVQHKKGELPEALHLLQEAGVRVIVARHDMPLPITIQYNTPETLGTDRIASAVAGHFFSPDEAVLVINTGTCLTTDLVTAKGEYVGGTISPGLQMRLNALHHYTGNLPLIDHSTCIQPSDKPTNPIIPTRSGGTSHANHQTPTPPGRSTHDSMLLGVKAGMAAEIDGLIDQYRNEISFFNVILSGGDIKIFDKKLKNRIFAVENIVLHGLNQMLIHNE